MWLNVITYYGDEANENSDFNLCKKLDYFNVVDKEIKLLNDGMNQLNCIFKLALMQIVSANTLLYIMKARSKFWFNPLF
jgi:hypothetical protein